MKGVFVSHNHDEKLATNYAEHYGLPTEVSEDGRPSLVSLDPVTYYYRNLGGLTRPETTLPVEGDSLKKLLLDTGMFTPGLDFVAGY